MGPIHLDTQHIDVVMKKMFEMAGVKFTSVKKNCQGKWFLRHTWTREDATTFTRWMEKYLMKNMKVTKSHATIAASMFVLNYGWKEEGSERKKV